MGAEPSEAGALEELGADEAPVAPVLPVGCVDGDVGWTGTVLDAPLGVVGFDEEPSGPVDCGAVVVLVPGSPLGVVESPPHAATRLVTTVRALTLRSAAPRSARPLSSGPKSLSNRLEQVAAKGDDLSWRITCALCGRGIASASECETADQPPSNCNEPRKATALSKRRKPLRAASSSHPRSIVAARASRRDHIGGAKWWEGAVMNRASAGPNQKRRRRLLLSGDWLAPRSDP